MNLHSKSDILDVAKTLALMVKRFKQKRIEEVGGGEVCHEVDVMEQQADMILQEYDAVNESLGDA